MTLGFRAAGVGVLGFLVTMFGAPAAKADSSLFGLDFGQMDLLDDVGDFWAELDDDIRFKLGAGVSVAPRFEGSDSYKARVMPKFAFRYKNTFALNNTRARFFLIHNEKFVTGLQARYRFGRSEKNSPDLTGLGNVSDAVELGGFAEWRPGWAIVGVEIGQDVAGGHKGLIAAAYAGSQFALGGGFYLEGGAQVTWVSENYMQQNFGVTAAQSLASGLPEYNAGSGLKDVAGRIGIRFKKWEDWDFASYVAYSRLMSDAANNPLVELRGSPNQFMWSISGVYRF